MRWDVLWIATGALAAVTAAVLVQRPKPADTALTERLERTEIADALRRHGDKEAVLYEVVTADTAEEQTSDRRREHGAYR